MRSVRPRKAVVVLVAALIVALLVYAWIDGGREPMHEISVPVAVPGEAR